VNTSCARIEGEASIYKILLKGRGPVGSGRISRHRKAPFAQGRLLR
jgi:hypothetical protein